MTPLCIASMSVSHSLMETGTFAAFSLRKKPVSMKCPDTKRYSRRGNRCASDALNVGGATEQEVTMRAKILTLAGLALAAAVVPAASFAGGPRVGVSIAIGAPPVAYYPPPPVVYYPPPPVA